MFKVIDLFGYEHPLSTEQEVINFALKQLVFSSKKESKLTNRVNSMKSGDSFFIDYGGSSIGISKE